MQLSRKAIRARLSIVSVFVLRHSDLAAGFLLFALTAVTDSDLFRTEDILGSDAATQYYPFYYFLGESLRSGSIPGWNPYQFSGTPFAADPLSGWTYLPAMVLFTLFPLVVAVKGLMFSHLLLAGLSTYALARTLGMGFPGAFLAAIGYEYSGLFYVQNTCCLQYIGVMAWLPLALLGAELAIRSSRWLYRGLWWGLSGLAISQILASWFGQGSYYALLALGGYVAYRTLLSPPGNPPLIRGRFLGCVLHGGVVLAFGFALAAAGVLPRLEYNALSNLAGGYPAEIVAQGGWSLGDWVLLLKPGLWYAGITILALALVAPLIAWGRFAVPYFAFLSLAALILTSQGPTPVHWLLYLLPYFERIHPHNPDRAIVIFYLGGAMLAGAGLTVLRRRAGTKPLFLTLPFLAALVLANTSTLFPPISEGEEGLYPLLGGWEDLSSSVEEWLVSTCGFATVLDLGGRARGSVRPDPGPARDLARAHIRVAFPRRVRRLVDRRQGHDRRADAPHGGSSSNSRDRPGRVLQPLKSCPVLAVEKRGRAIPLLWLRPRTRGMVARFLPGSIR